MDAFKLDNNDFGPELQSPLAANGKSEPDVLERYRSGGVQPLPVDDEEDKYRAKLKPQKTIRLAVSGAMMISALERKIIDTHAFQRLRHVRQLGMAYLVYPTATHTRFEHSLGTLQMVGEMIRAIRDNEHTPPTERHISAREETLARLYALLHDVTHVPFGHSIEDELGLLTRHDENDERIDFFLGPDREIGKIIRLEYGEDFLDDLVSIYTWDEEVRKRTHRKSRNEQGEESWVQRPPRKALDPTLLYIHDLISNTLCADLLDYLRRDRAACDFIVPRDYWFLNYLYIHREPESGRRTICLRLWKNGVSGDESSGVPRRDLLSDLCGLLEERYKLAERVYFHHAKIVATAMMGRAIQEAKDSGIISEDKMRIHGDDTLRYVLKENGNEICRKLVEALDTRNMHRRIAQLTGSRFKAAQAENEGRDAEKEATRIVNTPDERRTLENYIAEFVGSDPGDILIYAPTHSMNRKVAEMKVLHGGQVKKLADINDPLVKAQLELTERAHESLWAIQLLAKRDISAAAKQDAVEIFEAELLSEPAVRERRLHSLQMRKVEQAWAQRSDTPKADFPTFRRSMEKVCQTVFGINKTPSTKKSEVSLKRMIDIELDKEFRRLEATDNAE